MTTDGDIWRPPQPLPGGVPTPSAAPAGTWDKPPVRFRRVTGLVVPVLVLSAMVTLVDLGGALTAFGAAAAAGEAAAPAVAHVMLGGLRTVLLLAQLPLAGTWLLLVRRNAKDLDPYGLDHGAHWAYLGWIVPVASLFFPKRIVDDVWKVTAEGVGDGSTAGSTTVWWGCWVAYAVLSGVSAQFGGVHPRVDLLVAVASFAALLAWARVVRAVSATQDRLVEARESTWT
jgi:hypothetical protein